MLHELPFFNEALDRMDAARRIPEELVRAWSAAESFILPVRSDGAVPCTAGGALALRQVEERSALERSTLLGRDAAGRIFWSMPDEETESIDSFCTLRTLPATLSPSEAAIACTAVAYEQWHAMSLYCTACGSVTERIQGGTLRCCTKCSAEHFPRMDPAVIMLVTDGERCVLGQRQGAPAARWSPLAGFVEPGESAETAVRREVREESGLEVDGIQYVSSQPWPFPRSLMLGFRVHVEPAHAGDLVQNEEHRVLHWIDRTTLLEEVERGTMELPPAVSIASHLIRSWMEDSSTLSR